jgi:mannose-6-phosphate isomerase-like protein (cupin superfamily)
LVAEPGAALVAEAHQPGTMEHLTVLEGEFAVESAGQIVQATNGETVRYRADCPHSVRNTGDGPARALMVVVLGGPRPPAGDRGR